MSLELAKKYINEKDWMNAVQAIEPYMEQNPNDPLGLFCFGQIMLETGKQSIAYPIYKRAIALAPTRPEVWINMGKAAGELLFFDEEERCFKKALKLAKSQKNELAEYIATQNLGTAAVHRIQPDEAILWANRALKVKDNFQSKLDKGFAYLMKFNFKEGWSNYSVGMGRSEYRDIKRFGDEPEWDGSPDKRIMIYGEQGVGDQILFAGCVSDARRISKSVTLYVNPKLKNLFARSFVLESIGYDEEVNRQVDASASMSQIQQYFRDDIEKYSGKPYLIADPVRRLQWRALFDSMGSRPKIGIAWTGGVHLTQRAERSTTLEQLLPLLDRDVDWINLEYKDRTEEISDFKNKHGITIHDYSWALRTSDYDDTAALVNELDLLICVPTSVVHLGGALGVPTWCVVNPLPNFVFGIKGETMPYYNSVRLFRRTKDWDSIIQSLGEKLDEMYGNRPSRARPRADTPDGTGVGESGIFKQRAIYEGIRKCCG